jgi:hypothetical protein
MPGLDDIAPVSRLPGDAMDDLGDIFSPEDDEMEERPVPDEASENANQLPILGELTSLVRLPHVELHAFSTIFNRLSSNV